MIDEHGYPTEDALTKIASFDYRKDDPFDFAEYICENFRNGECRWRYRNQSEGCLELHTLGWSGCEDIIGALKCSKPYPSFWDLFWYQSRTGGHYWLRVRRIEK